MAKKPWHYIPWNVRDWVTSPTRRRMSMAERGLYRELLDYQWIEGPFPDDEAEIAAIAQCSVEEARTLLPAVRAKFIKGKANTLYNERLEEVRGGKLDTSQKRREAAKARWEKGKDDANASDLDKQKSCTVFDSDSVSDSDSFFADEGFREFSDRYRPLKDYGLDGHAAAYAYAAEIDSPNAAEIHRQIIAGVERMAMSGRPRRYLPTAEDFLKKRLFLGSWEPEGETKSQSALARAAARLIEEESHAH